MALRQPIVSGGGGLHDALRPVLRDRQSRNRHFASRFGSGVRGRTEPAGRRDYDARTTIRPGGFRMGAMNNVRVMPPPPAIGILTSQRESLAADQWRTMAVIVTEHLLEALKAPLSNPAIKLTPPLQPGEIYDTEELLARLKSL